MIEIRVIGSPAPQGSKKFVGHHGGKGIMVESSKAVEPWRESVAWRAVEARTKMGLPAPALRGPVTIEMIFTLPKPKSAPKRRTYPDRKPDVDKVARATLDALVQAGTIEDDARVISLWARKVYPGEDADALDVPGAVIRIEEML